MACRLKRGEDTMAWREPIDTDVAPDIMDTTPETQAAIHRLGRAM
jgi:hypothetical protein